MAKSRSRSRRAGKASDGLDRTEISDLDELLRFAAADPAGRKRELATAQAAFMRLARSYRRRAAGLPPGTARVLDERATEAYVKSLLAGMLTGRVPPPPRSPEPAPVQLVLPLPDAPTGVTATASVASATVRWTALPITEVIDSYTVVPFIGTTAQTTTIVPAPATSALVTGLTNGTTYTFKVKATNTTGTGPLSAASNAITPSLVVAATQSVMLPPLSSDPALLLDPAAESLRPLVEKATTTANKWRYEHLKELAIRAATDALEYEKHVASLMEMAVVKQSSAEVMLNQTMIQVFTDRSKISDALANLGSSHDVGDLLEPIGDAASQALLMPRFLEFLAKTSPIGFWIDLFEAMICDLATAFFSSTSFSRTKALLASTFSDPTSEVAQGIKDAANQVLATLDHDVDAMLAGLRDAVSQVVSGTRAAIAEVFESFDQPILMSPTIDKAPPDVPDVDPLFDFGAALEAEIAVLGDQIKNAIRSKLSGLANGSDDTMFVALAVTYLVLPIVVMLGIALAGGPFSAAILAAAVLLAAEELVHLLLRWLTGPLLDKVEEAKKLLATLVDKLQRIFAAQSEVIRNSSPASVLKVLAGELRTLKDLVPQAFLQEAASVLAEARDVVLSSARDLATAAERAAGMELGTAFEVVSNAYESQLTPAPLLPGGSDPHRFAAAALLRDLGRLEQGRTQVDDSKEVELTYRLSLSRMLGNGATDLFTTFRTAREAVIELRESDLVDGMFPGMYRVLLKEVRATGVFPSALPVPAVGSGVPISITHLGESRTRIKRAANPAAPPIDLPDCLRVQGPPGTDPTAGVHAALIAAVKTALETAVRAAWAQTPKATYRRYLLDLLGLVFGNPGVLAEAGIGALYRKCMEIVPEAAARAGEQYFCKVAVGGPCCGFFDSHALRTAIESTLRNPAAWFPACEALIWGFNPSNVDTIPPASNFATALAQEIQVLETGIGGYSGTERVGTPYDVATSQSLDDSIAAFRRRIARWGDATFVEDPDPQVRTLGYVTMVRSSASETSVFQLFPGQTTATAIAAAPITASSDGPPLAAPATQQYRLFENRGLGGKLLVRLESIPDATALLGGALPTQLSDQLVDVILEVTVRACYDTALAAAVRAGRQQTHRELALAGGITVPPTTISILDGQRNTAVGTSELRTVRASLRAQRDRALQAWSVAAGLNPSAVPNIVTALAGKAPLGRDEPFVPLFTPSGATSIPFQLVFDASALPATSNEATLLALATTLRISPEDLGFSNPATLLAGGGILDDARLVALGIAVIPTAGGVRPEGTLVSGADPLGLTLAADTALSPLLPGSSTTDTPLPARLTMTKTRTPPAVALSDLFGPISHALTVIVPTAAFAAAGRLYDVVFSATFRVPVLESPTAIAAIR